MCFLQSHHFVILSLELVIELSQLITLKYNEISSAYTKTIFKTIILTLSDNYSSTLRAHLKAIEYHTM